MPHKTILIAAGGTGGHLYPAMAVADAIRREQPEIRIIFVGTRDRIESREVPRAGYPFFPIAVEPPGRSIAARLLYPIKFATAIVDAMRLIARERPAAMLGGGAYLSVPVGIAAWAFHVPIALLEINSVAGKGNKILAWLSNKLFVAYPESKSQFPERIASGATVSGTPVREDLGGTPISQSEAREAFGLNPAQQTVLVFGGSLGARAINETLTEIAAPLSDRGVNVLWQTGKGVNLQELQMKFSNWPNVRVMDYIYDMEHAYAAADVVVCRAGASSLAELARLAKPVILVPWSGAAANHQVGNARAFERAGAACVVTDAEVKAKLFEMIVNLLRDGEARRRMSSAIQQRDNPDAAAVVAKWLIDRQT